MLYYDRTDVSEGIYINKTGASKEFHICHYWYFLIKMFKFQAPICNRCRSLLMMSVNLLKIKNANYRCIITGISKSQAINFMQSIDLIIKDKFQERFWNYYKFTRNFNLNKKKKKGKLSIKNKYGYLKVIYKNEKKNIKLGDTELGK